jgi:hypothetical protein
MKSNYATLANSESGNIATSLRNGVCRYFNELTHYQALFHSIFPETSSGMAEALHAARLNDHT